MLVKVIAQFIRGAEQAVPQDHSEATYCHLIEKEDGCLDWNRSAEEIERAVRAYQSWPHAFTTLVGRQLIVDEAGVEAAGEPDHPLPAGIGAPQVGSVVRVDKRRGILVHTGAGRLLITRVQLQGKRPMDAAAFANGFPQLADSVLGGNAT